MKKSFHLIKPNNCSRLEGKAKEVWEGKPVPVLREHQHTHYTQHVGVPCSTLQAHRHVPAPGIDYSLGNDGAELGHHVLVLVIDDLGVQGPGQAYN